MRPVTIDAATAQKMTNASMKVLDLDLSDEDVQRCADLLAKYGNGLPKKTARMLSNYIVNSIAYEMDNVEKHGNLFNDVPFEDRLKSLADEMKGWSEFNFGDARFKEIGKKLAQRQNDYIQENFNKASMFSKDHPDVFAQLYGDAARSTWKIGGKTFKMSSNGTPQRVGDKFLATVKDPAARKAISILFNQGNLSDLQRVMVKDWSGLDEKFDAKNLQGEKAPALPGGELFVSHDPEEDGCQITTDFDTTYELQMSKDGKTAVITITLDRDVSCWGSKENASKIGTARIAQRTTFDLTQKPMPVVTDVTFSQTFSPDKIRLNPDE